MISVILPVYNKTEERFMWMIDCIESVKNQTYKDWELVIVDDGSEGWAVEYLKNLDDKRIKVILNEHKGITHTRNTGVKNSTGEYIAMIDSDDRMVDTRLEESLKDIKGVDIVYSDYYTCTPKGEIFGENNYKDINTMTLEEVKKNQNVTQPTMMAKRECFEKFPYREIDDLDDDHYLIYQLFKNGYKFRKMKEPNTIRRYHATQHYRLNSDRYKKRSEKL